MYVPVLGGLRDTQIDGLRGYRESVLQSLKDGHSHRPVMGLNQV